MRGATPCGCSDSRSTLTGGSSRCGAAPAVSNAIVALASTMFHFRSTTTAGYGSCALSTSRTACRTAAICGESSALSPYTGAYPAASSR